MRPGAAQVAGIATGARWGLTVGDAQPHIAIAKKVIQVHGKIGF
jgi:hypothetical protein